MSVHFNYMYDIFYYAEADSYIQLGAIKYHENIRHFLKDSLIYLYNARSLIQGKKKDKCKR